MYPDTDDSAFFGSFPALFALAFHVVCLDADVVRNSPSSFDISTSFLAYFQSNWNLMSSMLRSISTYPVGFLPLSPPLHPTQPPPTT